MSVFDVAAARERVRVVLDAAGKATPIQHDDAHESLNGLQAEIERLRTENAELNELLGEDAGAQWFNRKREIERLREALEKAQHWHEQLDYDEALNVIDAALEGSR